MDTARQIIVRKMKAHLVECVRCRLSIHDRQYKRCDFGAALLKVYETADLTNPNHAFKPFLKMTQDDLALATLGADDDPNWEWVVCLDILVEQRCELLWAVSELHWNSKRDPGDQRWGW
jgi:hypothetical protein